MDPEKQIPCQIEDTLDNDSLQKSTAPLISLLELQIALQERIITPAEYLTMRLYLVSE